MNKYYSLSGKYCNKVKIGSESYIDLTDATVTASDILSGKIGYGADGSQLTGSCEYNNDTSDDDITASSVLNGVKFHGSGDGTAQQTGTMPNKGEEHITISAQSVSTNVISIPYGYYANGSDLTISGLESSCIAQGTTYFGVIGSHSAGLPTQTKSCTPSLSAQTISPDSGYTLSSVTVSATPITETVVGQGVTVVVCPTA